MLFMRSNAGVESTELVGIIAMFVVAIVAAFKVFGDAVTAFLNTLPAKLGFH